MDNHVRREDSDKKSMNGIIKRVSLENFMTFSNIEIWPGPCMNVVVAPNGCGKSSIVSGIMLALDGKPNAIGRGSNVGAFVRSGHDAGKAEVELLNTKGRNTIITRNILRVGNRTTWLINGSTSSRKEVDEQMRQMHIQVDNLCQMLPQDRVYEFSRMNPMMLLENTEKSVGPVGLFEMHAKLKEGSKKQSGLAEKAKELQKKLEKEEKENQRLSKDIDAMHQKQLLLNEVLLYKKKRAVLMYREQLEDTRKLQKERQKAQENLKKLDKERNAVISVLGVIRQKIGEVEKNQRHKNADLQRCVTSLNSAMAEQSRLQESVRDVQQEGKMRIKEEEARVTELTRLQQILTKLKNDLEESNKFSAQEIKVQIKQLTDDVTRIRAECLSLQEEEEMGRHKIDNIKHEIRAQEEIKRRALDVAKQRLQLLRRYNEDAFRAVEWLRRNKEQFTSTIYEPMLLEIEVKNPNFAMFIEEIIPARDMQAFTCESREDMNKFIQLMREDKGLRLNVLHSGPEHPPTDSYHPNVPLEKIRHLGFHTYLRDTFTAPEPIMKYLCRSCGVHRVPLGNAKVDSCFEQVPLQLHTFCSETKRYNVKVSKYSKQKCFSINSISQARMLNISMDQGLVKAAEQKMTELRAQQEQANEQVARLHQQFRERHQMMDKARAEKQRIQDLLGAREVAENRIRNKMKQIAEVEARRIDEEEVKRELQEKIKAIMMKMIEGLERIAEHSQQYEKLDLAVQEVQFQLTDFRAKLRKKQNDSEGFQNNYRSLEMRLVEMDVEVKRASEKGQNLYSDALKMFEGRKEELLALGAINEKREELSAHIQELQARADFLGNTDDQMMQEYEQRQESIRLLTQGLEKVKADMENHVSDLQRTRNEWLPRLQELVRSINTNFSSNFSQMGCAGEVLLVAENPDDYEHYGIHIRCKFRDSDQLQELNQYTQSGGERSVATALYMNALQELTYVPFRCVDEINQGMDPSNERRVFNMLVNATCSREDSPQYFLLTPKLLPGLEYKETITVTCVFNGAIVNKKKKWRAEDCLEHLGSTN